MVYPEEYATHLIGAGGLVVHNGNILLVKLLYGPAKGKYLIPGGFLEKGETLNQGVQREIFEETGANVKPIGILGIRTMGRREVLLTDLYCLLKCELISDPSEIQKQDNEVEAASWIDLQTIHENEEVHPFTKYLLKSVLDKDPMVIDEKHNSFMRERMSISAYEQYWVR